MATNADAPEKNDGAAVSDFRPLADDSAPLAANGNGHHEEAPASDPMTPDGTGGAEEGFSIAGGAKRPRTDRRRS
jgi:hypothetical protein